MRAPAVVALAAVNVLISVHAQENGLNAALAADPELSNFTTYLALFPDLTSQLSQLSNFTLAAPTNDAFAQALNSSAGAVLTTSNASAIQSFFEYHVLNGTGLFTKDRIIHTILRGQDYTALPRGAFIKYGMQSHTLLSGEGAESSFGSTRLFQGGEIVHLQTVLQIPEMLAPTRQSIQILSELSIFDDLDGFIFESDVRTYFIPDNAAWLAHPFNNSEPGSGADLLNAYVINDQALYSTVGGKDIVTVAGSTTTFNDTGGTSLSQSFEYVLADIPLHNGVLHIIDRVLDLHNTTSQGIGHIGAQNPSPTSATASGSAATSAAASSGISVGAKAGIGVGVALGVILAVALGVFMYLRRKRSTTRSEKVASHTSLAAESHEHEKPELRGSAYDATIAGPVKRKLELETSTNPVPGAPHPGTSELSEQGTIARTSSHELSTSQSTRKTDPSSTSRSTTLAPSDQAQPSSAAMAMAMVGGPTPSAFPQRQLQVTESHEELTEEADTLVSELGVIQKRKKTLNAAANAAGVRAEDVEGRKGEEYRRLVSREVSVRKRMEEVQEALQ